MKYLEHLECVNCPNVTIEIKSDTYKVNWFSEWFFIYFLYFIFLIFFIKNIFYSVLWVGVSYKSDKSLLWKSVWVIYESIIRNIRNSLP